MVDALDAAALLEKHNPILVIFPQEPGKRSRPGAWRPGATGRGDYHPCNVEFFLAQAHLRKQRSGLDLLSPCRSWSPLTPTGVAPIKAELASDERDGLRDWELDVALIPSQHESRAWHTYRSLLHEAEAGEHRYRCAVYGRYAPGPPAALQYWYLYIYNDFRNNHEADWEMVTIGLSQEGEPVRAGYSCHAGGSRRKWAEVETEGDRPIVHVAIGSHAGYFQYRPGGYPPVNLVFRSNLPSVLEAALWTLRLPLSLVQRLPAIRRWRDLAPADPGPGGAPDTKNTGTRICPELRILPRDIEQTPDSGWWWLRYRGKWGSTRPRLAGAVGVDSPWAGGGKDTRWRDPVGWLGACRRDEPT